MVAENDDDNPNPELPAKSPADTVQPPPSQAGGFRGGIGNTINGLMGSRVVEDEPVKDKIKDKAKDEAATVVRKEATQVARSAVRKIATEVAAWGARAFAAATSEVWLPIVLIIIAIGAVIVVIAVVISLAQSGNFGSSFHIGASSDTIDTTLANAGDVFARRKIDARDIPAILAAMTDVEKQANAKSPKEQAALDIATSIRTKLATFSSSDSKVDQQTLKDVGDLLQQLSAMGYGDAASSDIGKKIATLASYYASDPAGIQKFAGSCSVSEAKNCNGFAIRVMHETGADTSFEGTALAQLDYVRKRTDCYQVFDVSSTNKLAQGDLVFKPKPRPGGIHGHVAIYIGNGRIASASIPSANSPGHPPQIGKWYSALSVAARLKGGPCTAQKSS